MSIVAKNLTVSVASKCLLKNISFDFKAGEMIAVVGENGAGKTTLINCLTGASGTQNSVTLNGCSIDS